MVPFSKTLRNIFDASKKDDASLTWHHLIRMTMEDMGGSADFKMLYERLADHPKALKNEHFKDRQRFMSTKGNIFPMATVVTD